MKHIFQPHLTVPSWCGVLVNGKPCGGVKGDTVHVNAEVVDEPLKATDKQVGGDHYSRNKIQPIEYIVQNELDWFSGNVVKYITRFKHKNGKQDLEKVIHYAQLAIEHYYPEDGQA